jgi:hypothetical protein
MANRCSIHDCRRVAIARNWCRLHYGRWKRYGDPFQEPRDTRIIVEYQGQMMSLRDVAKQAGVPFLRLWKRRRRGFSIEEALMKPVRGEQGPYLRHNGYIHTGGSDGDLAHIRIAEAALGKPLPPLALIHHVNREKTCNTNTNLVICQNTAYHFLLHQRTRALKSCGHANWLKCEICKVYDSPDQLYRRKSRSGQWHRTCASPRRTARKRAARLKGRLNGHGK